MHTKKQLWGWSWFKKTLLALALLNFGTASFLYLTPPGLIIREFLAQTVISTQHRDWAWIVVGPQKRDYMVKMSHQFTETSALEKQDFTMIKHDPERLEPVRQARSIEELISEPKDISGQFWKGKLIYVYDPTSVRVVVPNKVGEGERISSMVTRTGAVAGINGGGFIDPDGLGNGFAPIGLILSGFDAVYTDVEPETPQHIIGFTKEGTLVVGKYSLLELREMGVKDAVSFLAPRLIANGNPQITTGDGGWGRAPRTAIGQKEDGTLIFVIIDGRQASSVGATLKEVQDLLLKEGAVNAGLLDGGASSELVVQGEVLTKPSSRYGERRLPSGILVYDDPDSYKADRIWDGLLKIDPGGRYDHPDYLKEQAELKSKQQAQQQTQQQTQQPAKTEPAKTQQPVKTETETGQPAKAEADKAQQPGKAEAAKAGQPTSQTSPKPQTDAAVPPKTGEGNGSASDKAANGSPGSSGTASPGSAGSAANAVPAATGSGAGAGATGNGGGSTDGAAGGNSPTPTGNTAPGAPAGAATGPAAVGANETRADAGAGGISTTPAVNTGNGNAGAGSGSGQPGASSVPATGTGGGGTNSPGSSSDQSASNAASLPVSPAASSGAPTATMPTAGTTAANTSVTSGSAPDTAAAGAIAVPTSKPSDATEKPAAAPAANTAATSTATPGTAPAPSAAAGTNAIAP